MEFDFKIMLIANNEDMFRDIVERYYGESDIKTYLSTFHMFKNQVSHALKEGYKNWLSDISKMTVLLRIFENEEIYELYDYALKKLENSKNEKEEIIDMQTSTENAVISKFIITQEGTSVALYTKRNISYEILDRDKDGKHSIIVRMPEDKNTVETKTYMLGMYPVSELTERMDSLNAFIRNEESAVHVMP